MHRGRDRVRETHRAFTIRGARQRPMPRPTASSSALALLLQDAADLQASVARLRGALQLQAHHLDAIEARFSPKTPAGRVAARRLVALRVTGRL